MSDRTEEIRARVEKATPVEQEVDMWVRELLEAGWRKWKGRRGREHLYMWVAPNGNIYRGPAYAWKLMRSEKEWNERIIVT